MRALLLIVQALLLLPTAVLAQSSTLKVFIAALRQKMEIRNLLLVIPLVFVWGMRPTIVNASEIREAEPNEYWSMHQEVVSQLGSLGNGIAELIQKRVVRLDQLEKIDFEVPKDIEHAKRSSWSYFNLERKIYKDLSIRDIVDTGGYVNQRLLDGFTTKPEAKVIFNIRREKYNGYISDTLTAIIPNVDVRLCVNEKHNDANAPAFFTPHVGEEYKVAPNNHQVVVDPESLKMPANFAGLTGCIIQKLNSGQEIVYDTTVLIVRVKKEGSAKWKLQ